MLTSEKVVIFKRYKGYYDGYHFQNNGKVKLVSDEEWYLLGILIQEIYLVKNDLASKPFEKALNEKLAQNCDSQDTVQAIIELEKYLNGYTNDDANVEK